MTKKEMIEKLEQLVNNLKLDSDSYFSTSYNYYTGYSIGLLKSRERLSFLIDEFKGEKKCNKSR